MLMADSWGIMLGYFEGDTDGFEVAITGVCVGDNVQMFCFQLILNSLSWSFDHHQFDVNNINTADYL